MKKSFTAIWVEETLIPSLRKQANMMEEVPLVRLSRRQQEILEDVAREQGGCIAFTYCGGYRLVQLNRDRHALWFARSDSEDRLRSTILHGTERRIRRNLEKARAGRQDAVEEIADKTLEQKTGARGLRSIIEKSMRDLMFELPSDETVQICRVTKEVIDGTGLPVLTYRDGHTTGDTARGEFIAETA